MRGQVDQQGGMFFYFRPEDRVPVDHPLRAVKARADAALRSISSELDGLYSAVGRPSIAPERLLKGQLLIALYSIRSDRALCEQLDYNLLYRWFLDLSLEEPGLDQSNFSRLRERLVDTDVAHRFFNAVLAQARSEGLLSTEHFTVDGTLIEALASLKSLKRKDQDGGPPAGGDGSGMQFISPRAQELVGLAPGEPLRPRREWTSSLTYHPDDVLPVRTAVAAHLRGESRLFVAECRIRHGGDAEGGRDRQPPNGDVQPGVCRTGARLGAGQRREP